MKTFLFVAMLLLTASCGPPPQGYSGIWLGNWPNAGKATIHDWATLPPDYQTRYVAQIASVAQQNGVRCQSYVTVGTVFYELQTRLNAGKYTGNESLVEEQFHVMGDLGCN